MIWLQEPRFSCRIFIILFQSSFCTFVVFNIILKFTIFWNRFFQGFFLLAAKFDFLSPDHGGWVALMQEHTSTIGLFKT